MEFNFSERDWERVENDWTEWWAGELERPIVAIECVERPAGADLSEAPFFASGLPLEMPVDAVIDLYQAHLETKRFYGDGFPRWSPDFGPGITAGFLGARVHPVPDDTVWFEPAEQVRTQDLTLRYDADNIWWQRVRGLTEAAVDRWGRHICVGITDLSGTLDLLAHMLTTEQVLLDLHDNPMEIQRRAREMTRLWMQFYDELHHVIETTGRGTCDWARLWSPGRGYMLQCDFAYMISPRMFEEFVLPDLETCVNALDYAFYHLDGEGQLAHLDILLSIDGLRGVQWVPGRGGSDPGVYLPILKRIRDGGKLCQALNITPEAALAVVRELGGKGFAFVFDQSMPASEAEAYVRAIAAEDGR